MPWHAAQTASTHFCARLLGNKKQQQFLQAQQQQQQ
jgi:hypothetical protein